MINFLLGCFVGVSITVVSLIAAAIYTANKEDKRPVFTRRIVINYEQD